jgi:glycine/serine hydroxymethyltransferase
MGTAEMRRIAHLIDQALTQRDDATLARIAGEVREMTSSFPLYPPVASRHRVLQTA